MLGQPKDNTVDGERISKDYRDRYANFSKGAHFSFGGQGKQSIVCLGVASFNWLSDWCLIIDCKMIDFRLI